MTDLDPHKQLGAALGRIPSGLFVLTIRHGAAETGMLASWVQQCAFEPPHVSVAIRQGREIAKWLQPEAAFTLNLLDDGQTDMIVHFGRGFPLDQPAFEGLDVEHRPDAAPILNEALSYLDCRVMAVHPVGDHLQLIAEVMAGKLLNEGHPMVHIRKSGFHY